MQRIGIIGGSGYIGSAIAEYLSSSFRVRVIDQNPVKENLRDKVEYQKCDILDCDNIAKALNDVDLVIHTAIIQIPLINQKRKTAYSVNFLGTQNVCRIVDETPSVKGMILSGTWHVFGEEGLTGSIDERFGFRPDKVEDRARLYALSKIAQEVMVRFHDEMSEKIYGVVRMATVLGEGMPEKTAANIFIEKGLKGEPITPFRHSMYRPMLYVDINDVCRIYKTYASKILNGEIRKEDNSLAHVVNLCWKEPMTIIELSYMIREAIVKLTQGKVEPKVEIIDEHKPALYDVHDKDLIKVDQSKLKWLINPEELTSPKESIERIVQNRINSNS